MKRFTLGVLVALAAAASAQDATPLGDYKLGEQLLTDPRFPPPKDRQVFAVDGHPELAVSLLGPEHPTKEQLDQELAALRQRKADTDRLAADGVNTLRVLDVGVIDGRPAYLHRRMATGTDEPNWLTERGPLLSETTKQSIDETVKKLQKSGLGVKEAEIWIDSKGRVFVDAPNGIVTPGESGPWSSFYLRQTTGHLESVKSLADISISHRKNEILRQLPEAKDRELARFFEFGTVGLQEGDVTGERALSTALAKYLSTGDTSPFAKDLGKKLAKGDARIFFQYPDGFFQPKPGELTLGIGNRSFPELAFDLVRSAADKAASDLGAVERSVVSDLSALEFWRSKKLPDKVAREDHPASRAGTVDAETLVREAEARSGPLSADQRAALIARANETLRPPSATEGLSNALTDRIDGARATEGER